MAHFTGRAEELARLDRWAADPQVALIGVTAWGGAGKTALVTHWVQRGGRGGAAAGIRGVFGWSFYADPSAEHWAEALLEWARARPGILVAGDRAARGGGAGGAAGGAAAAGAGRAGGGAGGPGRGGVRAAAGRHAARGAGRRLPAAPWRAGGADQPVPVRRPGNLRRRQRPDAGGARRSPQPRARRCWPRPAAAGCRSGERRDLVAAVDGHALAVGVLAGLLAAHPPATDLAALRGGPGQRGAHRRPGGQGAGVLRRPGWPSADRYLLAAVSLFARPVDGRGGAGGGRA